MKRKVLCVFSFLLILLLFCTMVSPKVEEEMRTLAEARKTYRFGNSSVGAIAIEWKESDGVLFQVVEGKGWGGGWRVAELPGRYYTRHENHVEFGPGAEYIYIYSASRQPVAGTQLGFVETKYKPDTYLLWHPESLAEMEFLPNSLTLISKGENVALMDSRNGADPYFEHGMWYTFKEDMGQDVRVYSLRDVESFTKALPWITGILCSLICSLLIWAGSWILSRKRELSKKLWVGNGLLVSLLLGSVLLLRRMFDLPASLMPEKSILDISHYTETFQRIRSSMDAMADQRVENWLSQAGMDCALIAGLSLLLTVGILVLESRLCRRSEK